MDSHIVIVTLVDLSVYSFEVRTGAVYWSLLENLVLRILVFGMSEGFILLDLINQVLLFVESGCVVEFDWILDAY